MPAWANVDTETGGNKPDLTESSDQQPYTTTTTASDEVSSSWSPPRQRCLALFLSVVSAILFILFVFSVVANANDGEGSRFMWMAFYALHAGLAVLLLLSSCCFSALGCDRLILSLSMSLALWSALLLIVSSINASNAEEGPEEGGDIDGRDDKEAAIFEAAGAGLGLFSALFHAAVFCCYLKAQSLTSDE